MKITKPTLLVSEEIARSNIERMVSKARNNGAELRPHFKTHQSVDIGRWFLNAGVDKATVSSVDMALYFAKSGWTDITIAFPYNPLECDLIDQLAHKITLNLTIVSKSALDHLNDYVSAPINYLIKVDVGTHRTGVLPGQQQEIVSLGQSKNSQHRLTGLLAHAGHAYQVLDKPKAQELFEDSMRSLSQVKKILGRSDLSISYGDTPTCSILDNFPGVDELRPGNFVFYDIMQAYFQSCSLEQIAVCLACPVVAKHPDRNEIVVYGGAVHLSKDFIEQDDRRVFGYAVALNDQGWTPDPIAIVDRLSQEHGILKVSDQLMDTLQIGDLVGILPVHSCLTADLQGYYVSLGVPD